MPVHYLDESNIFLFLLQLAVLLGAARLAGLLLSRIKQPAISGEILVGVLFGPTLLGRFAPDFQTWLFPPDVTQQNMLETVAWLGILFFLLVTGLETDFSVAWRQRREALWISVSDLLLPMLVAFIPAMLLPARFLPDPDQRLLVALFLATIMTISALPVTARVLQELSIYRTDIGLLIMCALTINDVAGWLVFAVILGFVTGAGGALANIPWIIGGTILFTGLGLTVGRVAVDKLLQAVRKWRLPEPGTSLTLVWLLGLVGGAITVKIGIHALFGFFLAGILAGESKALSENTRNVISQTVRSVLVPIFFATVALKIDFLHEFNLWLVLLILAIGVAGRFAGAWIGARLAGQPSGNLQLIAAAHTPGGEMQIVIGLVALEYRVISEELFVAVVVGAILSTVFLGPWMKWAVGRMRGMELLRFLAPQRVQPVLQARERDAAITELCELVSATTGGVVSTEKLAAAVIQREQTMSTALGDGVAVPHARLPEITEPMVALGRSATGIEWNAPDGQHVHFVFLLLTSEKNYEEQLRLLQAVAELMQKESARQGLEMAADSGAIYQVVSENRPA